MLKMERSELTKLKIGEIQSLAKENGIKNITRYKKHELIEMIAERTASEGAEITKDAESSKNLENAEKAHDTHTSYTARGFGNDFRGVKRTHIVRKRTEFDNEKKTHRDTQQPIQTVQNTHNASNTENAEGGLRPAETSDTSEIVYSDPVRRTNLKSGVLEVLADGFGFLRCNNYQSGTDDVYVPMQQIRRFNLKTGDYITGNTRMQHEGERFQALLYVQTVNGDKVDVSIRRKAFDDLTPIYPKERLRLERGKADFAMRLIDLVAPIGKGQRGIIVAPPKAGKTTLLKSIANSITENNPDVHLIVLLIDERPEEVTDMQRSIKGDVVYSTFDEEPANHAKVAEIVLERAKRLVEHKKDVVILLDSLTRLARAYNLTVAPSGRTLSGGLDPGALYRPKRFFGAARNIEEGGSLTILATALVETGSRMDDVIFEEFKGTGNMEVHLDRKLQEKRIFPAVDIAKSGTRKEELLMSQRELEAVWTIRKAFGNQGASETTENIINRLIRTNSNEEFIENVPKIFE